MKELLEVGMKFQAMPLGLRVGTLMIRKKAGIPIGLRGPADCPEHHLHTHLSDEKNISEQ